MTSRPTHLALVALAALVAACGDEEKPAASVPDRHPAPATTTPGSTSSRNRSSRPKGTKIVLRQSEFGTMLFNRDRQAIYVFQRDERNTSNCYGGCAKAWPPVYTKARPRAGKDVRSSLLGTIERRDGRRQVTYAGRPLYYYAHEGPGEVLCHNVNLNGGLWWVVGPDGRRRP